MIFNDFTSGYNESTWLNIEGETIDLEIEVENLN